MEQLRKADLEREADAFDAAAFATPGIDPYCSCTDWILPSHAAWGTGDVEFLRGDHGYAAFQRYPMPRGGRAWIGLDPSWGFACPVVGPDPGPLASEVADALRARTDWDLCLLSGIVPGSALHEALLETARDPHGPVARRWIASLDGGMDAYLARRSPKHRENVRRARRRAVEAGIAVEPWTGGALDDLFRRILDVERRSWKGATRTGLLGPEMLSFYRAAAERTAPKGRLRALFARAEGEDVGYILGGVRDGTYRGFQFSFDRRFESVSLGTVLQAAQIEALCDEGVAAYDLGTDMDYKRHWADEPMDTITLVLAR